MDSFRIISRTLFYRGVPTFFFYVVVRWIEREDETMGAFLRCVFASTLDIITLPKHSVGILYICYNKSI